MQVMKQLIKNPNPRSAALGWELMHTLCKEVPPDEELTEFVRTFITDGGPQLVGDSPSLQLWAKSISQSCIQILDRPPESDLAGGFSVENIWNQLLSLACTTQRYR